MKTERGDAIFILYLESKLVPSWAELPISGLSSSLLSTRDKEGKGMNTWASKVHLNNNT